VVILPVGSGGFVAAYTQHIVSRFGQENTLPWSPWQGQVWGVYPLWDDQYVPLSGDTFLDTNQKLKITRKNSDHGSAWGDSRIRLNHVWYQPDTTAL
jgi:hypothetical protein